MKVFEGYTVNDLMDDYCYKLYKTFTTEDKYDEETYKLDYVLVEIRYEKYKMLSDGNVLVNHMSNQLQLNGPPLIKIADNEDDIRSKFIINRTDEELSDYDGDYFQYLNNLNKNEITKVVDQLNKLEDKKIKYPDSYDYKKRIIFHQNILAKFEIWYESNCLSIPNDLDIHKSSNLKKFPYGYLTQKCIEFADKHNLPQKEPVRKYMLEILIKELQEEGYPFKKDPYALLRSTFSKKGYSIERKEGDTKYNL